MKLSDFDYNLPKELIAQMPISPRDHSRLMILDRRTQKIEHKHFYDIADYLQKGDVLVLNNTKVFPARLIGKRQDTGGKVEVFLLKLKTQNSKLKTATQNSKLFTGESWEALIGNRRKKVGQIIEFDGGSKCEIIGRIDESVWEVKFNKSGSALEKLIDKIGQVPIPPYIKAQGTRHKAQGLKEDYQTIYAKHRGSVAAPTAGFHFTKQLIDKLKKKGVQFEYVTLHVGLGTFAPVKEQNIKKHKMHAEFAVVDKLTAQRLNLAKSEGRRIIAVGTTAVRTLEAFSEKSQVSPLKADPPPLGSPLVLRLEVERSSGRERAESLKFQRRSGLQVKSFKIIPQQKWTDIFIYPGYQVKFVDAMITNFHLPKSTLLMLLSALAGRPLVFKAYQTAIREKYRFYSFGDAMFVL